MEIDLIKILYEGSDDHCYLRRPVLLLRMNKLLSVILKSGTMADLQAFFDGMKSLALPGGNRTGIPAYQICLGITRSFVYEAFMGGGVDNENYRMIVDSDWLSRFGTPQLLWFYEILRHRYRTGRETFMDRILPDRRTAAEKRALLCHAVFDSGALIVRYDGGYVEPPFGWYNRDVLAKIVITSEDDEASVFIKHTGLSHRSAKIRTPPAMAEIVENDRSSLFELTRQFEGRRICTSMLEYLIKSNAARCFTCLVSHYPEEVFRLRPPEAWLFTVCRNAKKELAVAAVDEIERQFPGIVGSARDPWGNTLLWNTFVNGNPAEALRDELIRLGCDPNAANEWGLSYQLLKDNDPEKLLNMRRMLEMSFDVVAEIEKLKVQNA